MTILLTAVATLIVTVAAGLVLDYLRRAKARIVYSVRDAIPIKLDNKTIGAYLIEFANQSKQTIRDVTCHVKAEPATLRNGGIWTSQGLQYSISEENGILLTIQYLNQGDEMQLTAIAESSAYVPKKPEVAIRAPQQFSLVNVDKIKDRKGFKLPLFMAGSIASLVTGVALAIVTSGLPLFSEGQKDVLTFAAAVSGLPQFSSIYSTADRLSYYNQGDLAFAYASQATDAAEIDKYRRFLLITLDRAPRMLKGSRSVLYYNVGKIDLLLKDREKANIHFRRAYELAPSLIKGRLEVEESIKQYFFDNALMK
jgi:tetratricopeptide (TPR) repeat protein